VATPPGSPRRGRRARIALLLVALVAPAASAQPLPTPLPPPGAVYPPLVNPPTWCWIELRLFDTLKHGPFEFCRKHLRYRPGALECYRIVDRVCAVQQADGQVIDGRTPVTSEVFRCPQGPEPPVCRRLDIR
jgi:hypothetical protein